MNRLNSRLLHPFPTRFRDVSGDGQNALVHMLRVSPSRSRLPGPHRYQPGIVQQAQGRSITTTNLQSIRKVSKHNRLKSNGNYMYYLYFRLVTEFCVQNVFMGSICFSL
jgi:hypothetical protein